MYAFDGWEEETIELLPEMRTDITLEQPTRKLVIDAKFYQEPMKSSFAGSTRKYASSNLYQLTLTLRTLQETTVTHATTKLKVCYFILFYNPSPSLM